MTEPKRPLTVLSPRRRVLGGDASMIVGLPRTTGLQYLVLLAAAMVDVVAFKQVLTQAIDEYEWVLWGFVVGFTVVCLALSHAAGRFWKEATIQRHAPNTRAFAVVGAGVWIALGLAAFLVRLFYSAPTAAGTTVESDDQAPVQAAGGAAQSGYLQAILFLVLYLGTGALSGAMAYTLHNPAAKQWARAVAKRAKAAARLAALQADLVAAEKLTEEVGQMRARANEDKAFFHALPENAVAKLVAEAKLEMLGRGIPVAGNRQQVTGADRGDQNGKDRR